jgi:NAD-dependent SIR2 family protein deacetylase
MGRAEPNAGHVALAELAEHGAVSTVITQNVDGLHQRAGQRELIELHGHIGRVRCLSCGRQHARAEVQDWLEALNPEAAEGPASCAEAPAAQAPRAAPDGDAHLDDTAYAAFKVPACPACQGLLKPDVVFFGDNVPRERVASAMQAVEAARGLLVVGSSLMVYSGFRFAEQAHRLGKPVVAINQGLTRADALLSAKIGLDCGKALARLAEVLRHP